MGKVELYPRLDHISRNTVSQYLRCGLLDLGKQQLGLVRRTTDMVMAGRTSP